jgi:hypothetical protein
MSLHSMRRHASSTINKNQQAITIDHRQCSKTHLSTFSVGTLALGDRRKPTLAAASASWAFFAVASSRCSLARSSSVAEGWWRGLGACESEARHSFSPSSEATTKTKTTMESGACEATRCPASSPSASAFSPLGTRAAALCRARFSSRSSRARTS